MRHIHLQIGESPEFWDDLELQGVEKRFPVIIMEPNRTCLVSFWEPLVSIPPLAQAVTREERGIPID